MSLNTLAVLFVSISDNNATNALLDHFSWVWVGLFDTAQGPADRGAKVDRVGGDVTPVGARGDGEAVVVGFDLVVEGVAVVGLGVFVVPGVRNPLQEQHREHVGLEVRRFHRSTQRVRRTLKPPDRFLLSQRVDAPRHPCGSEPPASVLRKASDEVGLEGVGLGSTQTTLMNGPNRRMQQRHQVSRTKRR